MRWPLGVVDVVYARRGDVTARAFAARADGYEHIDAMVDDVDAASLPLPIGCATSFPKPHPGWCATPAPPAGEMSWERAVRWWREAPGALLEPWAGAVVNSIETVRAFREELPGVRLLVDTGHVADWGEDPCDLLDLADHVQLRQGKRGHTQVHVDDPTGEVDFRAVLARLERLDYRGKLSIEYFDLPQTGWPLEDPEQWANDLAARLRTM